MTCALFWHDTVILASILRNGKKLIKIQIKRGTYI